MRKNDAFVAKIVNTRLTKGFMAIFAPAESLPSPATLLIKSESRSWSYVIDYLNKDFFCVDKIGEHKEKTC